jgi:hypothetical protein
LIIVQSFTALQWKGFDFRAALKLNVPLNAVKLEKA